MTMADHSGLYVGYVMHQRLRPRRHRFAYRVFNLLVDIDELPALDRRLRLFSVKRFNLFGLDPSDYGDRTGADLRGQVETQLRAARLPTGGKILLLTMPRVLGHVFNPLSVWFCHAPGADGLLQAIVYEVSNTFGERHSYLIPVCDVDAPTLDQRCDKQLYVSPFNGMAQRYRFRVAPPGTTVSVGVSVHDDAGAVLNTRLDGQREPLTDSALMRVFLTHPLLTFKIVAAIHWEALRLWLKRVPMQARPSTSAPSVTIVTPSKNS